MKKLIVLSLLLSPAVASAAPGVFEVPVTSYGTPTTVSVSTITWTKAPAATSLTDRTAIIVNNPNANTARMVGHIGGCSATSIATTVQPLEFAPSTDFTIVPLADGVCLWLLSLHSAAENVHVQEVSQK